VVGGEQRRHGKGVRATHILEVAERMADRIGVMVAGRLLAEGSLDDLRRQVGAGDGNLEDTFLALLETGAAERTLRERVHAGCSVIMTADRLAWVGDTRA
jgi:ABC-type multidrug transport system ATPase subunit